MSISPSPLAVYIHWPFCRSKCPYCDFNSHVRERVDQAAWREALLAELAAMAEKTPGRQVVSLFFGGGTPSLMPPETAGALIEAAGRHWVLAADAEITLEANPTSVEAAAFEGFRAAGVNRVSLGVQALNAADLKFLGRQHGAEEALAAVRLAARVFPRHSFDLIYARPGQTRAAWAGELSRALEYANGHLSLYQLTIEENTAFHHAYAKGGFTLPDEEESAALYELTQEIMQRAGLPAYEVSNHARPGQESRHNLAYWRGGEYIGIGPGAHGRVRGAGYEHADTPRADSISLAHSDRIATATLKSPERWLEAVRARGHGMEAWQPLTGMEAREERLMMRLRLAEGAPREAFPFVDAACLGRLREQGFLTPDESRIQLSLRGRLVLNAVTAELLA